MKKIGIITFNRAKNYGAVLQAYALKRVCECSGYETHIVDYNKGDDTGPHPIRTFRRSNNKKKALIRLVKNILSFYWDCRRWDAFKKFRLQYLDESVPCQNPAQILSLNYDAYIMGSDQIWNFNITGGEFDPVYFGNLSDNITSVVYGASAQDTPFTSDKEQELRDQLAKTGAVISIREKKLADYVTEVTGKKYPVVADPILLAGKDILKEVEGNQRSDRPYIFLYQIDRNTDTDISIRSLEKRFKYNTYSMTVPKLGSTYGKKGDLGPEEFLAFIRNAEFIVTNSFHGVVLSIIYQKKFYVYDNKGVMSRVDSLLDFLGLMDRKIRYVSDIKPDSEIDFAPVEQKLEQIRKESFSFLQEALRG